MRKVRAQLTSLWFRRWTSTPKQDLSVVPRGGRIRCHTISVISFSIYLGHSHLMCMLHPYWIMPLNHGFDLSLFTVLIPPWVLKSGRKGWDKLLGDLVLCRICFFQLCWTTNGSCKLLRKNNQTWDPTLRILMKDISSGISGYLTINRCYSLIGILLWQQHLRHSAESDGSFHLWLIPPM